LRCDTSDRGNPNGHNLAGDTRDTVRYIRAVLRSALDVAERFDSVHRNVAKLVDDLHVVICLEPALGLEPRTC
jgi:hypothetical protein